MVSIGICPGYKHLSVMDNTYPQLFLSMLDAGVETATIDIDGNGGCGWRNAGTTEVYVRWSDSPYSSWSSPITIATGIADDDICAVTASTAISGCLVQPEHTTVRVQIPC